MSDNAIEVHGLWKNFRLYHERNQHLKAAILRGRRARYEEFWALKGIDLEIPHGSTFGLIGSNGSGKSTLLKCLARILYPNRGSVEVSGRLSALLELGAGFHPELSGRENVYLNGAILGLSKRDLMNRFDDIVEFAGIENFIDAPVKNYSSGMTLRLGFAIASHVEPEILLIDEVLAVGDQAFQLKCIEKIESFRDEGRTIVIVSHGLASIHQLCETTAWLEKGVIKQVGNSADVITAYTGESFSAQPRQEGDFGSRWGTGQVEVTAVRILNDEGVASLSHTTGGPIEIEIDFESHRILRETVFGIKITNLHGTDIWASNSKRRRQFIENLSDSGTVRIRIPSLPLLEGTYSLTVTVTDHTERKVYDCWDKRIRFDVSPGANFDEGLITVDSAWDTSQARR
jgi:ABC-2 type transport system ATP-binding protein